MILRENINTEFDQGLGLRIETPCAKIDVDQTYLQLKNDLTQLNGSDEMTIYQQFKLDAINPQFNAIFTRGNNSNNWVQIMIVSNDVVVDVYGVSSSVGRYTFNDLVYVGYKYDLLIQFDGNKAEDRVTVNLNNKDYLADIKPATEPTVLASFDSYTRFSSSSSGWGVIGELYGTKVWNSLVSLEDARASLQNPILDISFDTVNNNYQFDKSGNDNHALWNGTAKWTYSRFASQNMIKVGYSLYQKSGEVDLYIPYNINGVPIVPIIGTDIPMGYTKTKDVGGSDTVFNQADSVLNFNYWGGTNSEIQIFDRSNETIHNATSRASQYYDGTNKRTSSQYHISEITNYNLLNTYFNTGYTNRVFPKIEGDNLVQILNYKTKKEGSELTEVLEYIE